MPKNQSMQPILTRPPEQSPKEALMCPSHRGSNKKDCNILPVLMYNETGSLRFQIRTTVYFQNYNSGLLLDPQLDGGSCNNSTALPPREDKYGASGSPTEPKCFIQIGDGNFHRGGFPILKLEGSKLKGGRLEINPDHLVIESFQFAYNDPNTRPGMGRPEQDAKSQKSANDSAKIRGKRSLSKFPTNSS